MTNAASDKPATRSRPKRLGGFVRNQWKAGNQLTFGPSIAIPFILSGDVGRCAYHYRTENLENDGSRPPEEKHAVHRRHRPKQAPTLDRNDVAIPQRRIVHECKIQTV